MPAETAPVEARSQATGHIRLIGYVTYDAVSVHSLFDFNNDTGWQVKDPASEGYHKLVKGFEGDIESFFKLRGRSGI